ncbi:MAG: ABC transporter substrate-binding protein [Acidimicrobiia bacterium]|nr:ABC transporter substrate-binding protein [Acidimicrobiia bacterium]
MIKRKLALVVTIVMILGGCSDSTETTTQAPDTTAPSTTTSSTPAVTTTVADVTTTQASTTTSGDPVTDGYPVTITHGTGEVTLESRPEAIVSISPTATEILFALGAGNQVAAVDSISNFPADAPVTELNAFAPSVEAIAAFEPDLVVMSFDPGDIESGLNALGIPVIVQFSALSLDDAYAQIEALGAASGHVEAAAEIVDEMGRTIDELNAELGRIGSNFSYYHELDDTYFSVTSSTFIGEIYSVVGLQNIADPADAEGFGFPQLSPEFILEADPDLIFLADTKCCGQTAQTLAERPGWDQLSAVQNGNVIELDDDIASRWGPRVIDFLGAIVAALEALGE